MNLSLLKIVQEIIHSPITAYHGTDSKFKSFNFKKALQKIIWFTSDKKKITDGELGAAGHGYIITAKVTINNPAGWDEYDKYSLDELEHLGFDGAILLNPDKSFDCFVFSPKQIKIIKNEQDQ